MINHKHWTNPIYTWENHQPIYNSPVEVMGKNTPIFQLHFLKEYGIVDQDDILINIYKLIS